jgi:hypothetical protein
VAWRAARTVLRPRRAGALVALSFAITYASTLWFPQTAWYSTAPEGEEGRRPRLTLSEPVFEQQQALMAKAAASLAPQRPAAVDVYGVVYAPYADEDVFLREGALVREVLERRFDAQGRVIRLANHATTTATLPWATPGNLRRALHAIAQRMDRERDVLVVYMTSHGARDFRLAASHWPLEVEELTPAALKEALDAEGIRHRVLIVSACYSGGWVDALASDDSLVMTAADATHTSYGCGRKSELTFFGRAMFDEQLRSNTLSFEKAFEQAVPVIRQREEEAKKPDGFSNPQLRMGERIRPVLQALEQRLGAIATRD